MASMDPEQRKANKAAYAKEWRARNPEKVREWNRRQYQRKLEQRLEYQKEYRLTHQEAVREWNRKETERVKAMRMVLLEEQLAKQGGRCAICGVDKCGGRGWCMDHDARCCTSDKPSYRCGNCEREVLCTQCNVGIGMFHEDPVKMKAAMAYVIKYRGLRLGD